MTEVTIEGSITPSAVLARGQRRTVVMTDRIQRLIERGYVVLVEDSPAEPPVAGVVEPVVEVVESVADPATPPALNASRELWAQFLNSQGIAYPDGQLDADGEAQPWAGRDELIDIWDDHQ